MVDSLLRLAYAGSDAAAATTAIRAVLGSAELTMRGRGLEWTQTSLVDDGISLTRIAASGDAVQLALAKATELVVVHVRDGALHLRNGDQQVVLERGGLGLIPIDAHARLRFSRVHVDLLSLPPAPLARLLGVPTRAVQLHAPRIVPRSPELAEYLRRVAHLLTTEVFAVPEVYGSDLVRTHTIDMFTAVTVEAFELTNRSEEDTGRDVAVLRRALAELRTHLSDPLSIPEVAQAAGVSVRGLQLIFQRQLGVSPLLHLRSLRLEAAHDALAAEAEIGTTIAEIARRFGYSNSGRFSTHYRDAYGESPAARLQRVRDRGRGPVSPLAEADIVTQEPVEGRGSTRPSTGTGSQPL